MEDMVQYTFTFDKADEFRFKQIRSCLGDEDYEILSEIAAADLSPKLNRYNSTLSTVMKMNADSALTFRLGMDRLIIKRLRSDEEEAALIAERDKNKVVIRVKVDGYTP